MLLRHAGALLFLLLTLVAPPALGRPTDEPARTEPGDALVHSVATGRTWVLPRGARSSGSAEDRDVLAAEHAAGGSREARPGKPLVFGDDDRVRVGDTTSFPFSAVCKLRVSYPSGKAAMGSGVLVGATTVLTAGHVVYQDDDGGWASSIEVIPGYDDGDAPYGRHYAASMMTLRGWIEDETSEYDFGALSLDEDVGAQTGYLGVRWRHFNSPYDGAILNTAGYPGDLESGEAMYFSSGPCSSATSEKLFYAGTMDTAGGQSGSGVWEFDGENRWVVGIHTGSIGGTSNQAIRITENLFNNIQALNEGTEPEEPLFQGQSRDFRFRRWNVGWLNYGDYVAYEFELVPSASPKKLARAKVKFQTKGGWATIERPDGTTFTVEKRWKDLQPQYGRYRVLFHGSRVGYLKKFKLKVKPSWKW